jgi:diguanylate cyclase (GGDEF)-like protein
MGELRLPPELLALLLDSIGVGVVTVDQSFTVLQWNRFLALHSGVPAEKVVGQNLFRCFPELPRSWLEKKIRSIFLLKNYAFTSWQQRPHLFQFDEPRALSPEVDSMRQDCSFVPLLRDGKVEGVSIIVADATDNFIYHNRLNDALVRLAALSERDALTGLFNRRKLEELMTAEASRFKRYKTPASVLMFDMDNFKRINDAYGHAVGDEAIRHVAKVALHTLRTTDLVARYGGEEFVALLIGVGLDGARITGERLRVAVAGTPFTVGEHTVSFTISVGAAGLDADSLVPSVLLQHADAALYHSKRNGRDRVTTYPIAD